jgi:hypothetical protein
MGSGECHAKKLSNGLSGGSKCFSLISQSIAEESRLAL